MMDFHHMVMTIVFISMVFGLPTLFYLGKKKDEIKSLEKKLTMAKSLLGNPETRIILSFKYPRDGLMEIITEDKRTLITNHEQKLLASRHTDESTFDGALDPAMVDNSTRKEDGFV